MNFHDFLQKAHSQFAESSVYVKLEGEFRIVPRDEKLAFFEPLEKSHVFYLGDDADFTQSVTEIRKDLHEEMRDGLPMPFLDVSVVSIVKRAMDVEREKRFQSEVFGAVPVLEQIPEGAPVWVLDRLVKVPKEDVRIVPLVRSLDAEVVSRVKDWFVMSRCQAFEGHSLPIITIPCGFVGPTAHGTVQYVVGAGAVDFGENMASNFEQVAAISHPANYVVRVTPNLSPREERRVRAGSPRPPGKRTHFIVVDHEVVVRLRDRKPVSDPGDRVSPVPHARRGHWKRLAERCRHARMLGRDRVWTRPTFVGERTFSDERNLYEVLLDFGRKV